MDFGNYVVHGPIYDEYQEDVDDTLKFDIYEDNDVVHDAIGFDMYQDYQEE